MPTDDKHDLFNLAEVIQKIADKVLQDLDLENLTSSLTTNVKNLGHLGTIAEALAANVIAQHGTDEDKKLVVKRLKAKQFAPSVEHIAYDDAGHLISSIRDDDVSRRGGTAAGNASAQRDAQKRFLEFFERALGQPQRRRASR